MGESGSGEYLGILWAELPVYILILLGWVVARGRVMDPTLSLPPLNTCEKAPFPYPPSPARASVNPGRCHSPGLPAFPKGGRSPRPACSCPRRGGEGGHWPAANARR